MPVTKLKEFLDSRNIHYETIRHVQAITAQEVAAAAHVRGHEFAKTVVVKLDDRLAMVVLPATAQVNLGRLKRETGAKSAELANEEEFRDLFPECETGAMPPFGNLYDVDVFVDAELAKGERVAFNAGTHTELVKMRYKDFEKLVQPTVVRLSA